MRWVLETRIPRQTEKALFASVFEHESRPAAAAFAIEEEGF